MHSSVSRWRLLSPFASHVRFCGARTNPLVTGTGTASRNARRELHQSSAYVSGESNGNIRAFESCYSLGVNLPIVQWLHRPTIRFLYADQWVETLRLSNAPKVC